MANQLSDLAERLTGEVLAGESEILGKPELLSRLAIPAHIRRCLETGEPRSNATDIRVMRFDFHYTTRGWQISEVNADVPGGYVEAAGWNELFAGQYDELSAPGSPTRAYAKAISDVSPPGGLIALAHATVYSEDRQVMVHLGRKLQLRGLNTQLVSPRNILWHKGEARLSKSFAQESPAAIVRLSPAEWLPNMCDKQSWQPWFWGGKTPLSNPGKALISQSKRFPLVWDGLKTDLSTWRKLLPKSVCPSEVNNLDQDDLVLKPAFGRVGEDVGIRGVTDSQSYKQILRAARKRESHWIAQNRFKVVPVPTEDGDVFPCIGVFTVNGKASGFYGRAAHRELIDQDAFDVAVLISCESLGRLQ